MDFVLRFDDRVCFIFRFWSNRFELKDAINFIRYAEVNKKWVLKIKSVYTIGVIQ